MLLRVLSLKIALVDKPLKVLLESISVEELLQPLSLALAAVVVVVVVVVIEQIVELILVFIGACQKNYFFLHLVCIIEIFQLVGDCLLDYWTAHEVLRN